MFCAISGEAPEEPVVSTKSGHVFEKRVILKYLESHNNKDPFSDGLLTLDDLIPLKVNHVVKPRPTTATSIPSMLQIFQNEWDALMLETYSLKEQLDSVRQELSHALYQHDAACRVVARLVKERDEARNALANLKISPHSSNDGMEVEASTSGISEEVKEKIIAKSKELSKERKTKTVPDDLPTAEQIKEYTVLSSNTIHKTTAPGVTSLDINSKNQDLIVTGGFDSNAILFNRAVGKVAATLSGHSKTVTDVLFHSFEDVIFTSSKDKTVKIWRNQGEHDYQVVHNITTHNDEVVGVSLHPTGSYLASGSLDLSWAFHDIHSGNTLAQISLDSAISSLHFHPDGLLLGAGTEGSAIKIWDIKSQKNVATFEGHTKSVESICFSENGYFLASAAGDTVKIWDLRKLKNLYSVDLGEGVTVHAVDWDYSGTYLAVASNNIRVYLGKGLSQIATFSKHTKDVFDVKWGHSARMLASTSLDRSLKVWGPKKT